MRLTKYLPAIAMVMALAGCGGGGGSTTTTAGGTTTSPDTAAVAAPSMSLTLVDADGVAITNHFLSQTQAQFLKVILKKSTGAAASYTRVTITLGSTQAVLVPNVSAQLTDADGVLLMRIAPTDVASAGAVQVTAAATVDTAALTQSYDLQIMPGTVSLSGLSVSSATVQKGQSINVGVNVKVNGIAATSNSVAVTFTSGCGSVSPASSLVDASGKATAVVQTNMTGACVVTASSSGASQVADYTVTAPPITGLQFVSAAPSLIYQKSSVGANTSIVNFKVIDSVGNPVTTGVKVNASLTNTDGGIDFCGSTSSVTSGPDGIASFSVCAGTLPTTVQVRATLEAPNAAIATLSNLLTVQTGLPTQRFFDIAATKLNFYVGGYFTDKFNGGKTEITVHAADRQGNPVPDGTKIIFVSEGGQINSTGQSSCLIASGGCTVSLIGQDYRPLGSTAPGGDPRPGRVTVLAYTDGEEYFIDKPDANGVYNNRYDAVELFEDIGSPYIDKDESGLFLNSYKNIKPNTDDGETFYPMPTGSTGSLACPTNSNAGLSVQSTCNGKWDGYTKVRRQIVIVFSGDEIGQPVLKSATNPYGYDSTIPPKYWTQVIDKSRKSITVQLSDYDGNPLPADADLSTEIVPSTSPCTAVLGGSQIGNTTEPSSHTATLTDCTASDVIRFKVKVSSGSSSKSSSFDVAVP